MGWNNQLTLNIGQARAYSKVASIHLSAPYASDVRDARGQINALNSTFEPQVGVNKESLHFTVVVDLFH